MVRRLVDTGSVWVWVAEGAVALLFAVLGFLGHDLYARTNGNEKNVALVLQQIAGMRSEQTMQMTLLNNLNLTMMSMRQDLVDHLNATARP